jgi:hypothetical protein
MKDDYLEALRERQRRGLADREIERIGDIVALIGTQCLDFDENEARAKLIAARYWDVPCDELTEIARSAGRWADFLNLIEEAINIRRIIFEEVYERKKSHGENIPPWL